MKERVNAKGGKIALNEALCWQDRCGRANVAETKIHARKEKDKV